MTLTLQVWNLRCQEGGDLWVLQVRLQPAGASKTAAFPLEESSGHGVTLFAGTWCPLLTAMARLQHKPRGSSGGSRSSPAPTFVMCRQFMFSAKVLIFVIKSKAFYESEYFQPLHCFLLLFFLSILMYKVGVFLSQKICIQLLILVSLQVVWTPIKSFAESVTPFLSTCLCICPTRSSTPGEEAVPRVGGCWEHPRHCRGG